MNAGGAQRNCEVAVRVRLNDSKEDSVSPASKTLAVEWDDESNTITVPQNLQHYQFDLVFGPSASQAAIYSRCCAPLVQAFFKGYNCCILAYGQTGAGKTYTMGSAACHQEVPEHCGVLPRAAEEIFLIVDRLKEEGRPVHLSVTFLEVYNEDLRDLLDDSSIQSGLGSKVFSGKAIRITEDPVSKAICVVGVKRVTVTNQQELIDCLKRGAFLRMTASNSVNANSSRSHAIFTLSMSSGSNDQVITSKFHFVDLAGSERIKRTKAEGTRLKEGICINTGLLALSNVINVLSSDTYRSQPLMHHVPYRDSKLTRILQDSLGGNSRTVMIACVTASSDHASETYNTIKYAARARNIQNIPVVNKSPHAALVESYQRQIDELTLQILVLRRRETALLSDAARRTAAMEKLKTKLNRRAVREQRLRATCRDLCSKLTASVLTRSADPEIPSTTEGQSYFVKDLTSTQTQALSYSDGSSSVDGSDSDCDSTQDNAKDIERRAVLYGNPDVTQAPLLTPSALMLDINADKEMATKDDKSKQKISTSMHTVLPEIPQLTQQRQRKSGEVSDAFTLCKAENVGPPTDIRPSHVAEYMLPQSRWKNEARKVMDFKTRLAHLTRQLERVTRRKSDFEREVTTLQKTIRSLRSERQKAQKQIKAQDSRYQNTLGKQQLLIGRVKLKDAQPANEMQRKELSGRREDVLLQKSDYKLAEKLENGPVSCSTSQDQSICLNLEKAVKIGLYVVAKRTLCRYTPAAVKTAFENMTQVPLFLRDAVEQFRYVDLHQYFQQCLPPSVYNDVKNMSDSEIIDALKTAIQTEKPSVDRLASNGCDYDAIQAYFLEWLYSWIENSGAMPPPDVSLDPKRILVLRSELKVIFDYLLEATVALLAAQMSFMGLPASHETVKTGKTSNAAKMQEDPDFFLQRPSPSASQGSGNYTHIKTYSFIRRGRPVSFYPVSVFTSVLIKRSLVHRPLLVSFWKRWKNRTRLIGIIDNIALPYRKRFTVKRNVADNASVALKVARLQRKLRLETWSLSLTKSRINTLRHQLSHLNASRSEAEKIRNSTSTVPQPPTSGCVGRGDQDCLMPQSSGTGSSYRRSGGDNQHVLPQSKRRHKAFSFSMDISASDTTITSCVETEDPAFSCGMAPPLTSAPHEADSNTVTVDGVRFIRNYAQDGDIPCDRKHKTPHFIASSQHTREQRGPALCFPVKASHRALSHDTLRQGRKDCTFREMAHSKCNLEQRSHSVNECDFGRKRSAVSQPPSKRCSDITVGTHSAPSQASVSKRSSRRENLLSRESVDRGKKKGSIDVRGSSPNTASQKDSTTAESVGRGRATKETALDKVTYLSDGSCKRNISSTTLLLRTSSDAPTLDSNDPCVCCDTIRYTSDTFTTAYTPEIHSGSALSDSICRTSSDVGDSTADDPVTSQAIPDCISSHRRASIFGLCLDTGYGDNATPSTIVATTADGVQAWDICTAFHTSPGAWTSRGVSESKPLWALGLHSARHLSVVDAGTTYLVSIGNRLGLVDARTANLELSWSYAQGSTTPVSTLSASTACSEAADETVTAIIGRSPHSPMVVGATGTDCAVRLYDLRRPAGMRPLCKITTVVEQSALAYVVTETQQQETIQPSPLSDLISGGLDGFPRCWRNGWYMLTPPHASTITGLVTAKDSGGFPVLLSGSMDASLRLWGSFSSEGTFFQSSSSLYVHSPVRCLSLTPFHDGALVAAGLESGNVAIVTLSLDRKKEDPLRSFEPSTHPLGKLCLACTIPSPVRAHNSQLRGGGDCGTEITAPSSMQPAVLCEKTSSPVTSVATANQFIFSAVQEHSDIYLHRLLLPS